MNDPRQIGCTRIPHAYLLEMSALTDEEFGRLIRALLRYSKDGDPIEAAGNERFYINRVIAQENYERKRRTEISEERSKAGTKGAYARWHKESK